MSLAFPIEKVLVEVDPEDVRTEQAHRLLEEQLGLRAVSVVAEIEEADAVIVIGGDGSFLHAVREHDFASTPIVGISTGTLGYYMGTEPSEGSISYLVRNLAEGDYKMAKLPILELRNQDDELVEEALNEIVVKSAGFQAFKAGLRIGDGDFEHFVGNGLVFSTPQGSSGEALAEGGSFLQEGVPVYTITPEGSHMSKEYFSLVAPMVIGDSEKVELEVKEAFKREFMVGADGVKLENWPKTGTILKIGVSATKGVQRIRLKNHSYFQDVSRIFRGQKNTLR